MNKKWMILAAVLAAVLVIAFVAVHGVVVTAKVDGPGMENTEVKPDALEGAQPLEVDEEACAKLGVELVTAPISAVRAGLVRHDPSRLAQAVVDLCVERSVRIAGGGYRKET